MRKIKQTAIFTCLLAATLPAYATAETTSIAPVAEGRSVGPEIARGWHLRRQENYRPTVYGVEIVDAPARAGARALRMELRRGDCGKVSSTWSDCFHGNERVEMVTASGDYMPVNTRGEYGWSVYWDPDWNPTDLCEIVMGQFHQVDQFNPAFQFFYQSHGGGLQVKSRVDTNNGTFGKDVRTIIPEKELRGKWHDIRVEAYWRNKSDGYFRVFVDGNLAYDYKGRTTVANKVFYKLGLYRLAAEISSPTLVVYYANVWRK